MKPSSSEQPQPVSESYPQAIEQLFFDALPQPMVILNKKQCITQINLQFSQLTGYYNIDQLKTIGITQLLMLESTSITLSGTLSVWVQRADQSSVKAIAQIGNGPQNSYQILTLYPFTASDLTAQFLSGLCHDGCWAWNIKESLSWRSQRWLDICDVSGETGWINSENISTHFEFLNSSKNRTTLTAQLNENGDELVEGEGYFKSTSGNKKHVSWQGLVCEKAADQSPRIVMGSLRDMTNFSERNTATAKARDHLQHHSRLLHLGEVLATVSHELNQPLTAIATYASTLLLDIAPESPAATTAHKIETQALRAGSLLRKIRNFSKRSQHTPSSTPVIPIVFDVVEWMKSDWRCKNIHIHIHLDDNAKEINPQIICERLDIEQLLTNLISNAANAIDAKQLKSATDFSHEKIDITLALTRENKFVVTVADSGDGIPTEIADKIFEPFLSSSSGVGLGLSICNTITAELGGSLTYSKRAEGGTAFYLTLPTVNPTGAFHGI